MKGAPPMIRQTRLALRQFLDLFREAPPLPMAQLMPGAVAVLAFLALALWAGPVGEPRAFVLAFGLGLLLRMGLRIHAMAQRLRAPHLWRSTAVLVAAVVLGPVMLLVWMDNPALCQRLQSLYLLMLVALFLSDVIAGRTDFAALFWPEAGMARYLPALGQVMVLFQLAMLLLNETLIRALLPGGWLVFWAVIPVVSHMILSGLILTVVQAQGAARN